MAPMIVSDRTVLVRVKLMGPTAADVDAARARLVERVYNAVRGPRNLHGADNSSTVRIVESSVELEP
jgi:hypothetical protein